MVIDSQRNTYTFSRIMHLLYLYMLSYEQLGLYSVGEAGGVTLQSRGSLQLENLIE